jgi:hypothetical protein
MSILTYKLVRSEEATALGGRAKGNSRTLFIVILFLVSLQLSKDLEPEHTPWTKEETWC